MHATGIPMQQHTSMVAAPQPPHVQPEPSKDLGGRKALVYVLRVYAAHRKQHPPLLSAEALALIRLGRIRNVDVHRLVHGSMLFCCALRLHPRSEDRMLPSAVDSGVE